MAEPTENEQTSSTQNSSTAATENKTNDSAAVDTPKQAPVETAKVPTTPQPEPTAPVNSEIYNKQNGSDTMPTFIKELEDGKFDYSECKSYVTKLGDTLYDVAQENNCAMQQLRYFNGLPKGIVKLPVNRKIYIPNGYVYVPTGK